MKRLLIIASTIVAFGWCCYALAGHALADALGQRHATALLRLGEGKIISPATFVHARLLETLVLVTLLLVWVLGHFLIRWLLTRRLVAPRRAWLVHSVVAFLALNLWLAQAQRTALFWGLMWQGQQTQNLARFHLKLILAREQSATPSVALMGSSQMRAQVDEAQLTSRLAPRLRAHDFHYPGARAYDLLLLQPMVTRTRPALVVCYLSELNFYSGSATEVAPNFFTAQALPDLIRRGGLKFIPRERWGCGLLGQMLPVFQLREVLAQRLFGPALTELKPEIHAPVLMTNLAAPYAINAESQFHQGALEDFVTRAGQLGQSVVLVAGQFNPKFARQLDPKIREDMMKFLHALAARHPHVTLLENLPPQTEADYEDMTHLTKDAQARFTAWLAAQLEQHRAAR